MGLLDRLAAKVAEQITKAPAPTATPMNVNALTSTDTQHYNADPMYRDPILGNNPFPAAIPLFPNAINPLGANNRADPRRYEFLVAQNINLFENRLVTSLKIALYRSKLCE